MLAWLKPGGSSPGREIRDPEAVGVSYKRIPCVMFLVRSFNFGGAERQLVNLLIGLQRKGWSVKVACFYSGGPLQREVEMAGIPVFDLEKSGRWDVWGFLWRLRRLLKEERSEILHGYLPVPNLVALLIRLFGTRINVVWGVRASNVDLLRYDWLARLVFWLECRLARYADCIIVNSIAGFQYYVASGFPREKMCIIPNGIDTESFKYDDSKRVTQRAKWGIEDNVSLVGMVGRLDPMKDHTTFLQAVGILAGCNSRSHFICIGSGSVDYAQELEAMSHSLGLDHCLTWAGEVEDMAAAYSALDLAVSSSCFGEGFPNVVAEAMACGRPCAVTDVGDSAVIVDVFGEVVSPSDPSAMAAAIRRLQGRLNDERNELRIAVTTRIAENFSIVALVQNTSTALKALVN